MSTLSYTAKRLVFVPGHTIGTDYAFEIGMTQIDAGDDIKRRSLESLGGQTNDWFFHSADVYSLTTVPVTGTNLLWLREFWKSILGGEVFEIDLYGTIALPDNPISVKLVPGSGREFEFRSGTTSYIGRSFAVRAE